MSSKPRWRQVFDSVERKVGVPLEDVAASNRFVEVMAISIKVRRAASSKAWGAIHGVTGGVLRAVNIPTRDDVDRLTTHLSALAGEIRALEQGQRLAVASSPPPTRERPAPVRASTARTPAVPAAAPESAPSLTSGADETTGGEHG